MAASSPIATGKSSTDETLAVPVGVTEIVIRRVGHRHPALMTAARTRSRISRQGASGTPTTVKLGSPALTCTSTRTGWADTPIGTAELSE